MEKLKNLYTKDLIDMKGIPIMSSGVMLKGESKQRVFQLEMYKTYKTIEDRLGENPTVNLVDFQCVACKYGLNRNELYQNMIQLREKLGKPNGRRYIIL